MADINMVMVEGKVCSEVENRRTPKGISITTFRISNETGYMDGKGVWRPRKPQVIEISLFGDRGEGAAAQLCYDDHVIVEGTISSNEYNGKYYTKIVANSIMPRGSGSHKVKPITHAETPPPDAPVVTAGTPPEDDTDLPF